MRRRNQAHQLRKYRHDLNINYLYLPIIIFCKTLTLMKILLNIKETSEAVSMSESKIRRLISEKRFPDPIAIDGNVRWRVRDLDKWQDQLIETIPAKKRGRPRLAV